MPTDRQYGYNHTLFEFILFSSSLMQESFILLSKLRNYYCTETIPGLLKMIEKIGEWNGKREVVLNTD